MSGWADMLGRQRQVTEFTFDLDLEGLLALKLFKVGRLDLSGEDLGVWTTSRVGFGDYAADSASVQPLGFYPTASGLDVGGLHSTELQYTLFTRYTERDLPE